MKLINKYKALLASVLFCASAASHALVLDATDRGWYDLNGTHLNFNTNYIVGDIRGGPPEIAEVRNFFVFDLRGITGAITSATLHLFNPADNPATTLVYEGGFLNPVHTNASFETYRINNVSTSIASLVAGGTQPSTFADLGDGTVYGTYNASYRDNGKFIDIVLNAAALADLNASLGKMFAFGGNVTTLTDTADTERIFGFTNNGVLSDTQLVLTTAVPEPATALLFGLGLAGLLVARRRSLRM